MFGLHLIMDNEKKKIKHEEANDDVEPDQNQSDNVPTADSTANRGPSNPY